MQAEAILQMENIVKVFPGVRAVDDVSLEVNKGEIHALLGHNGAGKSTLVKVLSGAYRKDSGKILFGGQEVNFGAPSEAFACGIGMVYQELDLIPWLDSGENIFLGQKRFVNPLGFVNKKAQREEAKKWIAQMGVDIDVTIPVRKLSVSKRQIIAILKAISRDAKLIVFDEPTSALNEGETEKLFEIMRHLTGRGISLILITHRLEEVFRMADRVTLMRDGKKLGTYPIGGITMKEIVSAMTGGEEEVVTQAISREHIGERQTLVCRNLSADVFHDISFSLREGEVLGITGLIGCGATELAQAIFGAYPTSGGEVLVKGEAVKHRRPRAFVKKGMAYLPEDRKTEGLNLVGPVRYNLSLAVLDRMTKLGFLEFSKEQAQTNAMISRLDIKAASPLQTAGTLSGGNQQKIVFGKWLLAQPDIFVMCEPTRGIDIGTKREIHRIVRSLASQGPSILLVSSEVDEIISTCDRILFLYEGRLTHEVLAGESSKEEMMNMIYGVG